jgi:hypothetical protein
MSAQQWSTGPALIFVGTGSGGTPEFLGTAERAPRISHRPFYVPNHNDLAGTAIPLDKQYMGETGTVFADLSRWDEAVMAKICSKPNTQGTRGENDVGEYGAFMIQEGYAVPLWVQFVYAAKSAMSGMEAGYHYFYSWLESDDKDPGMQAKKGRVAWYCHPRFEFGANNMPIFDLYDHDMTGLPAAS